MEVQALLSRDKRFLTDRFKFWIVVLYLVL